MLRSMVSRNRLSIQPAALHHVCPFEHSTLFSAVKGISTWHAGHVSWQWASSVDWSETSISAAIFETCCSKNVDRWSSDCLTQRLIKLLSRASSVTVSIYSSVIPEVRKYIYRLGVLRKDLDWIRLSIICVFRGSLIFHRVCLQTRLSGHIGVAVTVHMVHGNGLNVEGGTHQTKTSDDKFQLERADFWVPE